MLSGNQASGVEQALQRISHAIQGGRADEAGRLAQAALENNKNHPQLLHLYGYALLMQERAADAIGPLEQAFRALRDPAVETQLAIALRTAGRTEEALNRLARAIKRKPPYPAAVHEYGFLLHSLGRSDEAVGVLKAGMETAPWMAELPLLLGWIFHARNDASAAKAAFARVLAINPNYPDALYGIGMVLMDAGEFAAAAQSFQRALQNDPSDQQSRLQLGACFLELGDSRAASACLRQVTRGGPGFYGKALKVFGSSSRGRFWLQPSAARKFFSGERD